MDNRENLWTRRSNTSKLSLSMSHSENSSEKSEPHQRTVSATKRFGGDSSHGGRNPFNAISPLTPGGLASPTTGGSSAFGLGSGAFASFGSAAKTPKTPGTAFDFKAAAMSSPSPATPSDKKEKPVSKVVNSIRKESISTALIPENTSTPSAPPDFQCAMAAQVHLGSMVPPTYGQERRLREVNLFSHLKRPSSLPSVSDYHVFKQGIRPVWEDDENKRGGKWIMRLKKGVADRYWEDLLLALVGDQFLDAGEEFCGFVLSVRSGEDVFSIWTKSDGVKNVKIRDTIRRVLKLPEGTNIVWRSHDDSIAQRSAIDQARHEKSQHEKRRVVSTDESREKSTGGS
ncbi:unnamed protein product [Alternaria alternata]